MPKSWVEKRDNKNEYQVKINPKKFADIPEGSKMLIPTPKIVECYVKKIPNGMFVKVKQLRQELAFEKKAEVTCPLVTGISLRIISEAAYEEYQKHKRINQITPFWRVIDPESKLAKKLTFGTEFLIQNQFAEGIEL